MAVHYTRLTEQQRQRLLQEGYTHVLVRGLKSVLFPGGKRIVMLLVPLLPAHVYHLNDNWVESLHSAEVDDMISFADALGVYVCEVQLNDQWSVYYNNDLSP